jgi:hypothetical protein
MSPVAIAVISVLSVWLLVTAIVQLPMKRCRRIRLWDPVGHLLPGWNFFAPKPVRADFAVWYRGWGRYDNDREEVAGNDGSPWLELAGIEQRRRIDGIVNPARYTRKSIFTCCTGILTMISRPGQQTEAATGLPSDAVLVSLPYLLLINKVTAVCPQVIAVQFRIDVICYDAGTTKAATVFHSAVHRTAPATSEDPDVDVSRP